MDAKFVIPARKYVAQTNCQPLFFHRGTKRRIEGMTVIGSGRAEGRDVVYTMEDVAHSKIQPILFHQGPEWRIKGMTVTRGG